jgi:hypothetical protein
MFRAESESSRRYSNPATSKAKKISSQKDQLIAIMSQYMSRTSSKEEIIKSLDVLKKEINSPS